MSGMSDRWTAELKDLREHWGGKYEITIAADGTYMATRPGRVLSAGSAYALHGLLLDDCSDEPLPVKWGKGS